MEYGALFAVKDINRTRKFYEDLFDLKIKDDFGRNIAFEGGLCFQQDFGWLVGIPEDEIKTRANNSEISFMIDDFDGFVDGLRLRNDIEFLHDVMTHDWGQRVIRFYDPDEHLIEVGETLNQVIKRFQGQGMDIDEIAKEMDISEADINRILKS